MGMKDVYINYEIYILQKITIHYRESCEQNIHFAKNYYSLTRKLKAKTNYFEILWWISHQESILQQVN